MFCVPGPKSPNLGVKEVADAAERLHVLKELAEPGFEVRTAHAVAQAGSFQVAVALR
jgi:hypothetical protein